ncbi:MAG: 4Fe-4S dicluster domain-containing protein [Candidatus Aquicultor sp.]|nr:4Fe-4S dicluster domain-containing protein [Candidatus Aquicultor sp.]
MGIDRRDFLKMAGASAILAIGGLTIVEDITKDIAQASEFTPESGAITAGKWAMVIDVAKFKTEDDYKRVINACNSIHNIPVIDDPKSEVKWIWTDSFEHTFPEQQEEVHMKESLKEMPFLLLCNHCEHPPCVRVCPTKATFKRSDGIVMQDMHRCIGCRFCMAGCPYGSRSFNWTDPRPHIKEENPDYPTRMKGVVEKCTFCTERLAEGLEPACVEASNGAMVFGDITDANSEIRKVLNEAYTIRRKPELGTGPKVYYVMGGADNA